MPDISMCRGLSCSKRDDCYRYTATPTEYRQAYFAAAPLDWQGECKYFWPNLKGVTNDD